MKKNIVLVALASGCTLSSRINGELLVSASKIGTWNFHPQRCLGSAQFIGVDLSRDDAPWIVRVIHDELQGNAVRILERAS